MTNDAKTVNGELQRLDLTIDRWESRLKRAFNTLDKLKRKRKRLAKIAFAGPAKVEHKPQPRPTKPAPTTAPIESDKPAKIKATPKRRARTPDDFKAEMEARKPNA